MGSERCQPDGARETFVLLRVIVLQADLKRHPLQKLSALALVPVQDFPHRLVEGVEGDFAAHSSLHCDNRKRADFIFLKNFFVYVWTIFKVFIKFVTILFLFNVLVFLATRHMGY